MIPEKIQNDFPILLTQVYGKKLIYLDNSATTQLPKCVLECILTHYTKYNANVHRGGHWLSNASTRAYEDARKTVQNYIGAEDITEIVFTRGTTDGINMVSRMLEATLKEDDEIIITEAEHHSNYLPWHELCRRKGICLKSTPVCKDGSLNMEILKRQITNHTRLVAVTAISNVTGLMNPISEISEMAHRSGALVLVDGAQAMRTKMVNVQNMSADFLCFSGHKMLAPTGIGVLYIRKDLQKELHPVFYGGGMIRTMEDRLPVYEDAPLAFEAGTQNYAAAIGMAAAIQYMTDIGIDEIEKKEDFLIRLLAERLNDIPEIQILGKNVSKHGCISFGIEGLHPYDIASLLDSAGIAVRAGNHCAIPLHNALNMSGSVRISPAFYNSEQEIEIFAEQLKKCISVLQKVKKNEC